MNILRIVSAIIGLLIFHSGVASIQPEKVIEDWEACQLKSNYDDACVSLSQSAIHLKYLYESCTLNPQRFGLDIMNLQQQLVDNNIKDSEKKVIETEIEMRWAVVAWLESPK
jgi:hypothetical protein